MSEPSVCTCPRLDSHCTVHHRSFVDIIQSASTAADAWADHVKRVTAAVTEAMGRPPAETRLWAVAVEVGPNIEIYEVQATDRDDALEAARSLAYEGFPLTVRPLSVHPPETPAAVEAVRDLVAVFTGPLDELTHDRTVRWSRQGALKGLWPDLYDALVALERLQAPERHP